MYISGTKVWQNSRLLIAATAVGLAITSAQAKDTDSQHSIWDQDTLTGDWGGSRNDLKNKGIEFTLTYINEAFANLSGGLYRRGSYEGRFELSVDSKLDKLIGWSGASTHVTVYNIHNGGHTAADNVGSISDPSNIDAIPTTRLFTAWFQQNAFDDRLSIRIGQLAADDEFMSSLNNGGSSSPLTPNGLINATFGWANLFAANMKSGGPAYPLATPGARVWIAASKELSFLGAVLSGDPQGPPCNDVPQQCNKFGTTFSFDGGSLWMGEVQYAVNQEKDASGMAGVYKLGGWFATANFADEHFGLNAAGIVVSLANASAVAPLNHSGDWGIYAVADQMVWRSSNSSLNLFMRGGGTPSDRNLISYYADAGAGLKGPLPGRSDDVLTFGVSYSNISADAAALDRDSLALNGPPFPIRNYEMVFELSYTAQIAKWWTLQPDLQYIVHPGGNITDPNSPTMPIMDSFIAGARSTIKF